MRAKKLIEMYPDEWATIEASVWNDGLYQIKRLKMTRTLISDKMLRVVAYNAAFLATCQIHELRKELNKCQRLKLKSK